VTLRVAPLLPMPFAIVDLGRKYLFQEVEQGFAGRSAPSAAACQTANPSS